MDLKHIESLAKDKDLYSALLVSNFIDASDNELEDIEIGDYELSEIPKRYYELTVEKREKLVSRVLEFYFKDENSNDMYEYAKYGLIFQKSILVDNFDRYAFYRKMYHYM